MRLTSIAAKFARRGLLLAATLPFASSCQVPQTSPTAAGAPSPSLTTPANPAGGQPAAQAPPPAAKAPSQASFVTVQGLATFLGAPLANAPIRLFDAVSNQPAGLVSTGTGGIIGAGSGNIIGAGSGNIIGAGSGNIIGAGAGNVIGAGAGNIIGAGSGNIIGAGSGNIIGAGSGNLMTDAKGNFSVQVSGLVPGAAARLVASVGNLTVSSLVTGSGAGSAYRTLGAAQLSVQAPMNEVTTVMSQMAGGLIQVSQVLKPEAAAPIVRNVVDGLQPQATLLAAQFARNPGLATDVAAATDPETGAARNPAAVGVLIDNLHTRQDLVNLTKNVLVAIAHAASTPGSTQTATTASAPIALVGTGLSITAQPEKLQLTTSTGAQVDLPLGGSSTTVDAAVQSSSFSQAVSQAASPATSSNSGSAPAETSPSASANPSSATLSQNTGSVGTLVGITNTTFSPVISQNQVFFNGAPATNVQLTDQGATLLAEVPASATNGLVTVSINGSPPFPAGNFALVPHGFTLATVPVSGSPGGLAFGSGSAWVILTDTQSVQQVSLFANGPAPATMTAPFPAGSHPSAIAVDPASQNLWIANMNTTAGTGSITVLSGKGAPVKTIPTFDGPDAIAFATNSQAWVACATVGSYQRFDAAGNLLASGSIGSDPRGVAVDATGNAWFTNFTTNNLSVVAPSAATPSSQPTITTVSSSGCPFGITADQNGHMWVTNQSANQLSEFDQATRIEHFPHSATGNSPASVAIDHAGRPWVANNFANPHDVSAFQPDGTPYGTFSVGVNPQSVAVDRSGNIWVTNSGSNTLSVLAP